MSGAASHVPGLWATDVEILRLGGSAIEDRGDHLVVRSPHNPGYHWGNFVLVTDPHAVDHADRWIAAFDAEFPDADHLSIGLPGEPGRGPWAAREVQVEAELVLTSGAPVPTTAEPAGYRSHPIESPDEWAAVVAMDLAELTADGQPDTDATRLFRQRRAATRSALVDRGVAAFFGASTPAGLVAQLGIVLCGPIGEARQVARFQHVGTLAEHRGQGLASHLLGVAAQWAGHRGADRWEIHVDAGTAAHRLYTALGFVPHGMLWQATRATG